MNNREIRNEIQLKWFNQLVNSHNTKLVDFAYTITRSSELSEEIVYDVFIKIWDRRDEVSQIENLPSYLYRAVKNTALNYLEKVKRKRIIPFDNLPDIQLPVNNDNPEHELISKELGLVFAEALDTLPGRCKLIYKLAKEDGLKYREIASLLGISEKTVENQVSIALKKLVDCLNKSSNLQIKNKTGLSRLMSILF